MVRDGCSSEHPTRPLELRGHALRACGSSAESRRERRRGRARVLRRASRHSETLGDDGRRAVLRSGSGHRGTSNRRDLARARSLAEESLARARRGQETTRRDRSRVEPRSVGGRVRAGISAAGISLSSGAPSWRDDAGLTWWRARRASAGLADCRSTGRGRSGPRRLPAKRSRSSTRAAATGSTSFFGLGRLARIAAESRQCRAGRTSLGGGRGRRGARAASAPGSGERDGFESACCRAVTGARARPRAVDGAVARATRSSMRLGDA